MSLSVHHPDYLDSSYDCVSQDYLLDCVDAFCARYETHHPGCWPISEDRYNSLYLAHNDCQLRLAILYIIEQLDEQRFFSTGTALRQWFGNIQ
jgi:hypothetical protein